MNKKISFFAFPLVGMIFAIALALLPRMSVAQDVPPVRVLIVTGVDYPGHPWRTQAIELRKAFGASKQIDVRLADDVEILGTDMIFDYDVLMLNFKNYDPLKREQAAQANLLRFIREGGGLMYFHFTGGAFENWPEYRQIAGRVWNPEFRGHDPYQEFTVQITQKDHPIMTGIGDFKIIDELYTCLDGEREIDVLAEAKSSVDGKMYPIAFVFPEGKGRAFHTVLGHDGKAFNASELTTMLQNAALWCAKRESQIAGSRQAAAARLQDIANSAPEDAKLLAYFDCGGAGLFKRNLHITPADRAKPYQYALETPVQGIWPSQTSVLFDPQQVDFLIEGLDRSKKYQLNVVWWDCDASGRAQSITVKTPDETLVKIVQAGISLPDFKVSGLPPKTVSRLLPTAFVRDGKLLLSIKNEGGPNAVVSEIWINELP